MKFEKIKYNCNLIFFLILLISGITVAYSQNKKLDSLFNILKTARHDSTRYNVYMELGNHFQKSNPDTAIYFHTQAEKAAERISGPEGVLRKGDASRQKGWDYYVKSDFASALRLYEQVLQTAEKYIKDKNADIRKKAMKLQAACFAYIGVIYKEQGDYSKALEYYFKSLRQDEELGNKDRMARHYCNIGIVYQEQSDYAKALEYYFRSLKMDEENKNKLGQAINFGNIGSVYSDQGDYAKAQEYYFKALRINEEIGNKRGQAANLGNIGLVYDDQGDYAKALDYYFRALKIDEEMGNKRSQSINLGNIALVYEEQGDYAKALSYYFKAQQLDEEIGNKRGQAINLGNIGNVYLERRDYAKALMCFNRAQKLDEEIGNKQGQAINLGNIGLVYSEQGDYSNAMQYCFKALKINEEIGNKQSLANDLTNIGIIYTKQKKYKEAESYLKRAEQMHREMHTIYYLKDACYGLSELYEQTGFYRDALHYYKEYIIARDSVLSEENRKAAVVKEMKYNHEKEQALKEKEHQKQIAIEKEKQEKQKITVRFIVAGLILVLLFAGFVVNRLQVTRKQKGIIENQKQLVEEQKKVVEEQKLIVEQKNKDIIDSIKYSKRIQDAILPLSQKWKQHLPDSFILYLPKDIVAGDFYWLEVLDNYIYVAAADCTGHGVPGAMVSVVCSNALTKAVLEEKITDTDEILNRVREILIEKLTSEENIRDGMDVCLIRLTKETKSVQYSGANRPLYIVSPVVEYLTGNSAEEGTEATDGGGFDTLRYSTTAENHPVAEYVRGNSAEEGTEATGMQLIELKPYKQPIGRYEEMKPFGKQEWVLSEASTLYLTTDGYADQFGGEKGKKIGTKVLKELLKENSRIGNSEERREHLLKYFQQWKGDEEQMDDVTIIQIRF